MAGDRTQAIHGNIRNILKNLGMRYDDDVEQNIYDQIVAAFDQIIDELSYKKSLDITLVSTQQNYSMLMSSRPVVKEIKNWIIPTTWNYHRLEYSTIEEWNRLIRLTAYSTNPVHFTIIDDEIYFWPIPTATNAGDIVKFICLLQGSPVIVSNSVDPILPVSFDKCAEKLATYNLTGKENFYNDYKVLMQYKSGSQNLSNQKVESKCRW